MHGILPVPTPAGGRTIQRHLVLLVLGTLVPVLLFTGVTLWRFAEAEQARIAAATREAADVTVAALDRELTALVATAQVLAGSLPDRGGLEAFHARASEAARLLDGVVTLRDADSRQRLNTDLPWGAPLPGTTGVGATDREVARTGRPAVTDLYRGVLDGRLHFAVVLPIRLEDGPGFLALALPLARLQAVLDAAPRGPGEVATVLDGVGALAARSPADAAGEANPAAMAAAVAGPARAGMRRVTAADGGSLLLAERRSAVSPWRAGVAVPERLVLAPLRRAFWIFGLGGAAALALALLLATLLGRRLAGALDTLVAAGRAVVAELPVALAATPLREANQAIAALAEATGRRDAEAAARQLGEERLRVALLDAPILACSWDLELRYTWLADPQSELMPLDVIGRRDDELVPASLAPQAAELMAFKRAVIEGGARLRRTVRWRRRDGALHTFDLIGEPLREGGAVSGGVLAAHDVTRHVLAAEERMRLAATLSAEQARLAAVFEAVPVGLIIAEAPSGRIVAANRRSVAISGHPTRFSAGMEQYEEWAGRHADGRAVESQEYPLARVIARGEERPELELLYARPDGREVWLRLIGAPIRDAEGTLLGAVVACVDIDRERRDAEALRGQEARQRLLINELNHRVKNTLATVQSMILQSLRGTADAEEVRVRLLGRVFALAAAHDVLTRTTWEGAPLRDVLEGAIAPLRPADPARIGFDGPAVLLPPRAVLALSLAIHELAANAAKHGALSQEGGSVQLSWRHDDGVLRLRWAERGGPPVAPPTHHGFGSRLIERGLAHELGGGATLEFLPDGLVCSIEARLTR